MIPYDAFAVNVGGGMDLSSGVFTAPRDGYYFFSFMGDDNSETEYAFVFLRKNGSIVAIGVAYNMDHNTVAMSSILQLAKGDEVDVGLDGSLFSSSLGYIHFTGHLLSPPA